jgi:membrane protein
VLFFFWLIGLGMVMGGELNAALAETPEEEEDCRGVGGRPPADNEKVEENSA